MFDVFYWGAKPGLFAFEKPASSLVDAANQCQTGHYWYIYGGNDYAEFDFSWKPVPWEALQIHVFPSQWQSDGGICLVNVLTATTAEIHYRIEQSVKRLPDLSRWVIPNNIELDSFDFSWHPDAREPAYSYHFGTQWQSTGGPVWLGTEGVKVVDSQRARSIPTMTNWTVPDTLNSDVIDLSWHPSAVDEPFIYHFASEWQSSSGLVYTVPGATTIKMLDEMPGTTVAGRVLDVFFIDKLNPGASDRFEKLKEKYPNVHRVRYANSMMATVQRCVGRTSTSRFWVISSENIYDSFDFTWHPASWQTFMTHVFPTQWNKWSDTFLINKWEFERHSEWAKDITEFPSLNFVEFDDHDSYVKTANDNWEMFYVDHGNKENSLQGIKVRYPQVRVTRFMDSYLGTLARIMHTTTSEYVWVVSSICDYTDFDFSWHPEPWQSEMIHVFPTSVSGPGSTAALKQGDTFYIHVPSFKAEMVELEVLDFFQRINYCDDQVANGIKQPIVDYSESGDLISAIKKHDFQWPYVCFTNRSSAWSYERVCMWSKNSRTVRALTTDNGIVMVPREAKGYIKTQVYDYPYIEASLPREAPGGRPLDIIFISNGEPDTTKWYEHLKRTCDENRIDHVQNVNGRVAAYQAAARASSTAWFFAVFAKLEVDQSFDWHWRPDHFQGPKHYIFNSRNPLNGLEYGHQGVVAYNRDLVLENTDPGIDFTLSQPHESVPVLSGIAHFNQNQWMTWRTAFREVLKLKHFIATQPTLETEHRLKTWLTVANGTHAEWCLKGAADAATYYESVGGNYEKLKYSFEWAWLKEYFEQAHGVELLLN